MKWTLGSKQIRVMKEKDLSDPSMKVGRKEALILLKTTKKCWKQNIVFSRKEHTNCSPNTKWSVLKTYIPVYYIHQMAIIMNIYS